MGPQFLPISSFWMDFNKSIIFSRLRLLLTQNVHFFIMHFREVLSDPLSRTKCNIKPEKPAIIAIIHKSEAVVGENGVAENKKLSLPKGD